MTLKLIMDAGAIAIPPPPYTDAERQSLALRDQVARQARLIDAQADRIELLEQMLDPPGRRGRARLRRSAWWWRLARRIGVAG